MDETSLDGRGGCAEVRAYGQLFRYRRAGSGPPILLLRSPGGSRIGAVLFEGLAARFRLIEPAVRDTDADVARSLGCFLEGLGTAGVGIVADGCFGEAAVALARLAPHQIARIAVVAEGAEANGPAADDGALQVGAGEVPATAARDAPVPLLVLNPDPRDPARLAARLTAFLRGPGAA